MHIWWVLFTIGPCYALRWKRFHPHNTHLYNTYLGQLYSQGLQFFHFWLLLSHLVRWQSLCCRFHSCLWQTFLACPNLSISTETYRACRQMVSRDLTPLQTAGWPDSSSPASGTAACGSISACAAGPGWVCRAAQHTRHLHWASVKTHGWRLLPFGSLQNKIILNYISGREI